MQVQDEMDQMYAAINGKTSAGPGAKKGGPFRSMPDEAQKAADKVVAIEKKKQEKIANEEAKAEARKKRKREAAEQYVARVKERHRAQEQKAQEREAQQGAAKREQRIRAIAGGTKENLGKAGRAALGVAGSVARGAGVQTDLGAYVGQAVEIDTRATELSAAAYDEQRDKGKRIDPKTLVALGRKVGQEAAFDPSKVLEGLQAFVGKTGDLATGQAALPGLAKLARATGTSLEDMVGAAGEAAKAIGEVGPGETFKDSAEKGQALVNVLRLIAGQGKVGAVELKDLAQYGGRLAAAAPKFGTNAAQSLGDAGALAQLAVARGGAVGPAEAAMSVSGFLNTLKTPARMKEFKSKGVDVEGDTAGTFRGVRDILKDAASAAGGSTTDWKKMFANVQGGKAADPAFDAYNKAYAATIKSTNDKTKADIAGRAAIDAMFDKFGKAVSAEEEGDSFQKSMKSSAAQVQLFNNELSKIGGNVAEKVLPALAKLAPAAVNAADNLSKVVDFAVDNPGKAAGIALAGSIAKASIDTVAKEGIEKLITGLAGSAKGGKAMGALAIAATAITIGTVGVLTIDSIMESKDKGVNKSLAADAVAQNAISALRGAQRTGDVAQAEKAMVTGKEQAGALESRIAAAQDPTSFLGALFGPKTFEQREQEQQDAAKIDTLKADLAALKSSMDALAKGTLKVHVTNPSPTSGPTPDTGATTK